LLLGEGGLGKTLGSYLFADKLLMQWGQYLKVPWPTVPPHYFPIFIRPALESWSYNALDNALDKAVNTAFSHVPENIRFLFIFDAYDECEGRISENLSQKLGLTRFPNAKLL